MMDNEDESVFSFQDEEDHKGVQENSSSGSETTMNSRDEVGEIKKVINRETKAVGRLRLIIVLAMLAVAGAIITMTYLVLSDEQDSDFQSQFELYASTLLDSAQFSAESIRGTVAGMGDHLGASARLMGTEWPKVTVPNFDVQVQSLIEQTGAVGVFVAPIVPEDELDDWTLYSLSNGDWYGGLFNPQVFSVNVSSTGELDVITPGPPPYWPLWQIFPIPPTAIVNFNLASYPPSRVPGAIVESTKAAVVSDVVTTSEVDMLFPTEKSELNKEGEPHSLVVQPIFDTLDKSTRRVVANFNVVIRWNTYFTGKLPEDVSGIQLVLSNSCDKSYTYNIEGKKAFFLGEGDLHDKSYDSMGLQSPFNTYEDDGIAAADAGACLFSVTVYPTSKFEESYKSFGPIGFTLIVGAVFFFMIVAFVAYDNFQRRRNTKVISNAARSNALLTSLFPGTVRDRLLETEDDKKRQRKRSSLDARSNFKTSKLQLKSFLDGHHQGDHEVGVKPVADLFLGTTVMFADIVGFTAWSSERDPSQVFTLLETIFSALDSMAKKRNVFKVETVGDCYVAVAGLPDPRKDHAIAMARFARDTVFIVQERVKELEITLGPGTADLGIRIGLNSGDVTAGVLRGDRARFQLFGDTMNTTARIESSGQKNKVHMSKETAELLIAAGKSHWVTAREDKVSAKGKGRLETFWLDMRDGRRATSSSEGETTSTGHDTTLTTTQVDVAQQSKIERLIGWQVDVFSRSLKQVIARRNAAVYAGTIQPNTEQSKKLKFEHKDGQTCLDEVKEIIELPDFNSDVVKKEEDAANIDLGDEVMSQLRQFIRTVASMYRSNGFHNFEHACHVCMSVTKLLSRIVMPSDIADHGGSDDLEGDHDQGEVRHRMASTMHDHTFGITSDPLTQFALIFSALIHDVDHTGVPNTTLIEENKALASVYHNKSVAEQNSIELSWDLLQDDQFEDLRACIYSTEDEFYRFRQLVTQAVLATDIADKELKVLRNARWESAFADDKCEENPKDTGNRKATIVIEHLIQASDVAHTMQHWHVYRKWNECFFRECYQAFQDGRAAVDPSEGWYQGELGFFDFYIIPLARKLKKCGVFGVSSDEYLNYATKNRQEWSDRGQEIVEEMKNALLSQHDNAEPSYTGIDESKHDRPFFRNDESSNNAYLVESHNISEGPQRSSFLSRASDAAIGRFSEN